MVEARIQEGGFTQHAGISVIPKTDRRILIKPASYGFPRPTFGLKRAVRRVAGLVLAAHPDLKIHASSVGEPEEGASPPGASG
jgi:hypothetical protein